VRFLSNLSTGEMGYEIARAACRRRHRVTLISGPTAIQVPPGVKCIPVISAQEMKRACERCFPKHDVLIMTAAVCDFTAAARYRHKIHRTRTRRLHLRQTPDIVAGLAKRKGRRTIIGFCLETRDWIEQAKRKLIRKRLDGIVANYYREGVHVPFGRRRITTAFIGRDLRAVKLRNRSKRKTAELLLKWMRL